MNGAGTRPTLLGAPSETKHKLVRVIDESGEDYLYPERFFVPIELPQAAEVAFLQHQRA